MRMRWSSDQNNRVHIAEQSVLQHVGAALRRCAGKTGGGSDGEEFGLAVLEIYALLEDFVVVDARVNQPEHDVHSDARHLAGTVAQPECHARDQLVLPLGRHTGIEVPGRDIGDLERLFEVDLATARERGDQCESQRDEAPVRHAPIVAQRPRIRVR